METREDVVMEALKTHGFSSPIIGGRIISGKWNGEDASVFVYNNEADKDDVFLFLDKQVPHRVIALFEPIDEGMRVACEREGVLIWDRSQLEALVGRHTLLSKAGVKLREPLFPPEEERTVEVFSLDIDIKSEQVIAPQVSRAEVEHRGSRVGGFNFQLLMVPHYLFKYRCKLRSSSGSEKSIQGLMWVDAVDGTCRDMTNVFKALDDVDQPHFKQEPDIPLSEAAELVLQGISELNTRETEVVRHTGSATIFEKQQTYPLEESIETEYVGILFVPMWNVEGSRGTMTINGITSDIVREETYQSS